MGNKSDLEDALMWQLGEAGVPVPIEEHRFHPPRRWRFDMCWPDVLLAVEVEGGTFVGGRHTSGAGFEKDVEKYNQAAIDGWTVLRYTRVHIASGWALNEIEQTLRDLNPVTCPKLNLQMVTPGEDEMQVFRAYCLNCGWSVNIDPDDWINSLEYRQSILVGHEE